MSNQEPYAALDRILHQPIRTRIAAFLIARGEATFTDIKKALSLTDGNLEAHMKKLVQTGYAVARKENDGGRTITFYSMSDKGSVAFHQYVQALNRLLQFEA